MRVTDVFVEGRVEWCVGLKAGLKGGHYCVCLSDVAYCDEWYINEPEMYRIRLSRANACQMYFQILTAIVSKYISCSTIEAFLADDAKPQPQPQLPTTTAVAGNNVRTRMVKRPYQMVCIPPANM